MRFLHTADWHVGRTRKGVSRAAEFEAALGEVVEIARTERVDAMLVSGDIWDSAAPTAEADRMVYETLRNCYEHGIQVVLLAGNHDSSRRLEALGLLSDLIGIQTQSKMLPPDGGGLLTIEGADGHTALIAAVPFLMEGRFVDAGQVMGLAEEWYGTYSENAAKVYRAMCEGFTARTVNLLMGHIFVNGATYATRDGSERQLHIGQAYGIEAAQLPTSPQYIALGHIHRPQHIAAAVPAEYAGSLLQLDFGEAGEQKRVVIIDAVPNRPVEVRSIALTSGRPLIEIRGTPDEIMTQAEHTGNAWVRAVVQVERAEPGVRERLRERMPDAEVLFEYPEAAEQNGPALSSLAPDEQFSRYYRSQHNAEPDRETMSLFRELHDIAIIAGTEA